MTTEELAARQQAALDKAANLKAAVGALQTANAEARATINALQLEVNRLTAAGADLETLQARLNEATASLNQSNRLLKELQDALLDEPASEVPADPNPPDSLPADPVPPPPAPVVPETETFHVEQPVEQPPADPVAPETETPAEEPPADETQPVTPPAE